MGAVLRILLVLLAVGALGLALVSVLQRRLIYFPDATSPVLPSRDARAGLSNVVIETSDGEQLQAWHYPSPSGAATVLILHGNAANRGTRLELIRYLAELNFGVLALDYRGYGGSTGSPSEEGLYLDAEAAVRWLEARGDDEIVYFGESLGTGVAVELATRRPPIKLVLQAPFTSLSAVGRTAYPFLPADWILRDRFASEEKIGSIDVPLLVVHGVDDQIVPIRLGRRLFEKAREPKKFVAIEGAGHNDLRQSGRPFEEPLDAFLKHSR